MPVIDPIAPATVVPAEEGPCTWPLDTTCVDGWADYPPSVQSAATAWATYVLWALTGRRYGPCSVTFRPCNPRCQGSSGYMTWPVSLSATGAGAAWMTPFVDGGVWRNCVCPGACSCAARCEVPLQGPVAFIDEVMVDGIVIDPAAYRVDRVAGLSYLVRIDGECWPECQDMGLANDAVGAFTVTYQIGIPVPRAGQLAAGRLAGEFAKACVGADCRLPDQLVSLSRTGVEVQVADLTSVFEAGLTGVEQVDLWIRAVNPARKAQRSRAYSPDMPRGRFTA